LLWDLSRRRGAGGRVRSSRSWPTRRGCRWSSRSRPRTSGDHQILVPLVASIPAIRSRRGPRRRRPDRPRRQGLRRSGPAPFSSPPAGRSGTAPTARTSPDQRGG